MRRYLYRLTLVLVLLRFVDVLSASEMDRLFNSGNEAYQTGAYDDAIANYNKILELGFESWEVYFNIGNAHFKKGELGLAILNYERAKRLDPKNEDIEYNLEFANLATVDRIQKLPRFFLIAWISDLAHIVSVTTMTIIGLVLYFLVAGLFAAYLMVRGGSIRRGFLVSYICLAAFLLFFSGLFVIRVIEDETTVEAIVLTDRIDVRSAPDEMATEVFALHEGVKIKIQDTSLDWIEVKLEDGKVGWLQEQHIERI